MNLVQKLTGQRQAPKQVYGSPARSSYPFLNLGSYAGRSVTVDNAMELVPVYSAVSLLAGAIGSLPLKVYKRKSDGSRESAESSRQWRILHDQPNDEMAADEVWEMVAAHLLLWGNAYLWKERDEAGMLKALWPIRPDRIQVARETFGDDTIRVFHIDTDRGQVATELDILHIRGLSSDGVVGYSPVSQARNSVGNMQALEEFQGKFWKHGTFVGGILKHPSQLSADAQERLKAQMEARGGVGNTGRTLILEEAMAYETLTMPLRDAQFVEQQKLGRLEVAELFGMVPPHRWGTDKESLTYANTEMAALDFSKWTLRRWLTRIEQSLNRDVSVFPTRERKYSEFLIDGLLRADTKSRYEAYEIATRNGAMAPSEWREKENWAPLTAEQQAELAPPEPEQLTLDAEPAVRMLPAATGAVLPAEQAFGVLAELRDILHPEIRVDAPVIHVDVPRQLPADVVVDLEPFAEAIRALAIETREASRDAIAPLLLVANQLADSLEKLASREQPAPVVNIDVPEPQVQVTNLIQPPGQREVKIARDSMGRISGATVEDAD